VCNGYAAHTIASIGTFGVPQNVQAFTDNVVGYIKELEALAKLSIPNSAAQAARVRLP
jgi:hypothetical protein